MTTQEDWNPSSASQEMAFLFNQADKIINQPHYQDASADELEPPSADSLPTTGKRIARTYNIMPEPIFTPAEQKLLNFLDKLATSPYSTQLMEEGNRVLDAAVEENQRLQDSIHSASNAMRNARQCANLDGGIQ
jgi:hypothetical protein